MSKRPRSNPGRSTSAIPAGASSFANRKILVAVTGGIACYKSATLVSRLVQAGANVRVIMTESATRFVAPLTFQALSGQSVLTGIWQTDDRPDSQHVGLARWCDLMVIAPATADILARLANGLTDDLVSLTASALPRRPRATPVLLAPSMNAQMWENPVTQRNVETIDKLLGYPFIGPGEGWQACRTSGSGRMAEPEDIFVAARKLL